MASYSSLFTSGFMLRHAAEKNRWLAQAVIVLLGSSLLWLSAKVQAPFWPVPMTLQTYVVLSLGALLGWRLGLATMAAYIAEGVIGLPVFAGTPANGIGLGYIAGPTGGYLAGYVVAVALIGWLADRRSNASMLTTAFALLAGELTILGLGCSWLAVQIGWEKALTVGFGPFLVGDALKLVMAFLTIIAVKPRAQLP